MNTTLRISMILARADNPRLYDELVQFPKGQRRVNRLRTLAYDGLLAQAAPVGPAMTPACERVTSTPVPEPLSDRVRASLELFSLPSLE